MNPFKALPFCLGFKYGLAKGEEAKHVTMEQAKHELTPFLDFEPNMVEQAAFRLGAVMAARDGDEVTLWEAETCLSEESIQKIEEYTP